MRRSIPGPRVHFGRFSKCVDAQLRTGRWGDKIWRYQLRDWQMRGCEARTVFSFCLSQPTSHIFCLCSDMGAHNTAGRATGNGHRAPGNVQRMHVGLLHSWACGGKQIADYKNFINPIKNLYWFVVGSLTKNVRGSATTASFFTDHTVKRVDVCFWV